MSNILNTLITLDSYDFDCMSIKALRLIETVAFLLVITSIKY